MCIMWCSRLVRERKHAITAWLSQRQVMQQLLQVGPQMAPARTIGRSSFTIMGTPCRRLSIRLRKERPGRTTLQAWFSVTISHTVSSVLKEMFHALLCPDQACHVPFIKDLLCIIVLNVNNISYIIHYYNRKCE